MFRESPECFLIMPQSETADSIQSIIHDVIQNQGVQVISADTIYSRGSVGGTFMKAIERAHFVIADITEHNPNILFELGVAFGLRKRSLILSQRQSNPDLSPELIGQQVLLYDPDDTVRLRQYLGHWVEESIAQVFATPNERS